MTDKVAQLNVGKIDGRSADYAVGRSMLEPGARHSALALNASADLFTGDPATVPDMIEAIGDIASEAAAGDVSGINRMLTAQALSLDALFTQMVRRAHVNLGKYPDAAERYMRLAFKAQAQSRSTLEALVKMHQPREQTVRHIHVGPEGQAVFIENLHGGLGNARSIERAHAAGAGDFESGSALLGHDTGGHCVPVASGPGQAQVSHARRRGGKRRTEG